MKVIQNSSNDESEQIALRQSHGEQGDKYGNGQFPHQLRLVVDEEHKSQILKQKS